jgi:hypothetical protein
MTTYVMRDGKLVDKHTGEPTPDVSDGILTPQILSDLPAYYSVASGKWVDGRAARRDDLARTGCREVDPSEGPKYCHTKKWADRLRMDHQPPKVEPRPTVIGPEV